jgi:hypothetical protein
VIEIKWSIDMQSMYTDQHAKDLARSIREMCNVSPDVEWTIDEYTMLLSTTENIEFDEQQAGRVLKPLQAMQVFLQIWRDEPIERIWEYRQRIPYALMNEWRKAWSAAQNLFLPDPAELPTEALTEAQKVEAATPGSPLT